MTRISCRIKPGYAGAVSKPVVYERPDGRVTFRAISGYSRILTAAQTAYGLFRPLLGPRACRFHPTCSEYGFQSLKKHGVLRGGLLSAARILRCHPWNPGGHDPVP